MSSCHGKNDARKVLLTHAVCCMAGTVILAAVLYCRKKRTPADKLRRAFKEIEEKLEV